MATIDLAAVRTRYEHELRAQILPFWLKNGIDREHGGYLTGLDRRGTLIETDKPVWFQGRFAWLLATLYSELEPNDEWLELAHSGVAFLERHCFDDDGRMFYRVDREGRPLIKRRRYLFSECFAIIAMAAYGRASGEARYIGRARELLELVERYRSTPGLLDPKFNQDTRPARGFALPMILLAVTQELRTSDPAHRDEYTTKIDGFIDELRVFMKPEHRAVLEQVGADGELQDHFEGRLLNPGHAIEAAWFILREAAYRNRDRELVSLGTTIFDWMWEWGWDREHGGIIYYRDVLDRPATEYWHDMKFWWPQCEAIIAALRAFTLTGDERYARMFHECDEWAHAHFPDREHGEWFGYLHRDGTVSSEIKGNMFKGPFHIPRMYLECIIVANRELT
jgi:N-acylglucosamine 2-epimerase